MKRKSQFEDMSWPVELNNVKRLEMDIGPLVEDALDKFSATLRPKWVHSVRECYVSGDKRRPKKDEPGIVSFSDGGPIFFTDETVGKPVSLWSVLSEYYGPEIKDPYGSEEGIQRANAAADYLIECANKLRKLKA